LTELRKNIDETVAFIKEISESKPSIGIILGTGLGRLAKKIQKEHEISYRDIPHFPLSTVEFHEGNLILGQLGDKEVVAMQGRFHYYEGYTMQQITFPVRVMKALGVSTLMVSNACGGLNPLYRAGDIMVISDHINLLGDNPLIGANDDELGPRFPDMSEPYSLDYIERVEQIALEEKLKLHKGVYLALSGPNLETRSEYRMLRNLGADVVGMSTVPEVIVAVHAGLKVLGMSVITDECFPDALKPVDIKEILKHANEAEPKMTKIMERFVETF